MSFSSPLTRQMLAMAAVLAWGLVPAPGTSGRLRAVLGSDELSRNDYERMERGYYERLLDSSRALDRLAVAPTKPAAGRGASVPFAEEPLVSAVDDLREYVLKPNLSEEHFGKRWSTNALGMRDRSYSVVKPPHTLRIAFVGDSIGAGWGVGDGEGFEPLVERWLDERSREAAGPAVEVLNFAVPGHGPGARWHHFGKLGWPLGPDLVIFESTLADAGWDERRLRVLLPLGKGWDSPLYRDILARAGARPGGDAEAYKHILRPWRSELLASVYRTVVADCRSAGVPCVWLLVPRVGKVASLEDRRRMIDQARAAGVTTIVDLSDAYDGLDPRTLAIGPNDYHPNAEGHARLAQRLAAALADQPDLLRLGVDATEEGTPR